MDAIVGDLVVFDDGDARHKEEEGEKIERGVDSLASTLLFGCMRGLQGKNRLHQCQDSQGLCQRMPGEKDDGFGQDADPDKYGEEDDTELGDGSRA